jgi:Carbohydrate esterase 2 N-terminal
MLLSDCTSSKVVTTGDHPVFVPFNDRHIQYEGRLTQGNGATQFYWPGSSATIRFSGSSLKAVLQDYNGQNFFNIIIDNNSVTKIRIDSVKKTYTLAENLAAGEHIVTLFKITQINKEYKRGFTRFFGFEMNSTARLLDPPALPPRKMEFYGNSITCGHAILDTAGGDRGASQFENNYLSYAAITARHYNARYRCTAKSGIGIMVSFGALIMPEMYNRVNPFDSTSTWNFNNYTPDIIVVDLFQNDQAIVHRPENEQFKRRFGTAPPTKEFIISSYQQFIAQLRIHYPGAHIICALGSMDITREGSEWPGYVQQAVNNLHDPKIYTLFFRYKGSPKHPLVKDHEAMAESLVHFIDSTIKW